MAGANPKRTINANILLYGPKGSGKTSNLRFIQRKLKPEQRGEIEVLHQEGSPEVVYEYLPVPLGLLMGYDTNIFIYTVPDGEEALESRLSLLPNAAGVAFIGHSSAKELDKNKASLEALKDELIYFGMEYADLPILFQYNHRDSSDALSIEEMNRALNPEGNQVFEAVASAGEGVRATFSAISKLAVRRVRLQLIQDQQESGEASLTKADTAPAPKATPEPLDAVPPVQPPADVQAPDGAEPPPAVGARVEKSVKKPRLEPIDLETSGEFRRVNSGDFLSTDFGGFGMGEPMVLEAGEADDDDDEDLSMGPTTLTEQERLTLGTGLGEESGEGGGLVLHDIPVMSDIEISTRGAPSINITTYAEEEDEDDKINLLGRTSQLDESSFFLGGEEGVLDLELEDELALDFEEDLLSEPELEMDLAPINDDSEENLVIEEADSSPLLGDLDELSSEADESAEGDSLEEEPSPKLSVDSSAGLEELEDDTHDGDEDGGMDSVEPGPLAPPIEEGPELTDAGSGFAELEESYLEDDDDEAGPSTIAITSIPDFGADADDVAVAAQGQGGDTEGKAEILTWGEARRVDGENIILPVTVMVPSLGKEVMLEVTISARQVLGEEG